MATKTLQGYLYYSQILRPVLKKDGVDNPALPYQDKEYVLDLLITADTLADLKKRYKGMKIKALNNCISNEMTAKEFEQKYKAKPPFEAEAYYTIKLRKPACFKDGSHSGKVKILDRFGDEWDYTKLIGNGSKGAVQVQEKESKNPQFPGWSLPLLTVVIKELVPYVREEESIDYEFDAKPDDEDGGSTEDDDAMEFDEKDGSESKPSEASDDWDD